MPKDRFYLPQDLTLHQTYTITGPEAHHLNVMRIKEGEEIELINGKNVLALAQVTTQSKKSTQVKVTNITTQKPPRQIILAAAIPKPKNLSTILEKATELGATSFHLFPGLHSKKPKIPPQERLEAILISAMKQCGRLDLPTIESMPPLTQWNDIPGTALCASLNAKTTLASYLLENNPQGAVTLFIGPEKGWHKDELTHLEQLNAIPISLHKNTLRAETAGPFAVGLCAHLLK